jgi:predicted SPOUT superfamily RNA methylase MTH1
VNFKKYSGFKHSLIFFGGLGGIEGLVEDLETNQNMQSSNIRKSFDEYINTCPEIGTRNLRTEESILMTLGALLPKMRQHGI